MDKRGDIPHPTPHFLAGAAIPHYWGNHPLGLDHSGASADNPCKRRYWFSTLGT